MQDCLKRKESGNDSFSNRTTTTAASGGNSSKLLEDLLKFYGRIREDCRVATVGFVGLHFKLFLELLTKMY